MNDTMGLHSQLPSITFAEWWITVAYWRSGKKRSSTAAPVASALVIRPGTHVRRILQSGRGIRSFVATPRTAATADAVPLMTVESSLTGMTTVPRPLVAT